MRDRIRLVVSLTCLAIPASIVGGCSSDNAASLPSAERTAAQEAPEAVDVDLAVASEAAPKHTPKIMAMGVRSTVTPAVTGTVTGPYVSPPCTPSEDTLHEGSGGVFKLPSGATQVSLAPVLWGAGVNPGNATPIADLGAALGASASGVVFYPEPTFVPEPYMSWLQGAYGVPPVIGMSTTQTITPVLCNASTSPCTVTDAQIQTELARQVGLGNLEVGSALLYVLEFPPNVTINSGGLLSCAKFCAYHNSTSIRGTELPYIVLPDFQNTGCGNATGNPVTLPLGGCGTWPTWQGELSGALSHEVMETLSDPVPTSGWATSDTNQNCTEIGDVCDLQQVEITNNGYTAVVQKMWSNSLQTCVATTQGPDVFSVTPSIGPGTASTFVTVQGTGFGAGTTFAFGQLAATGVSCSSSTTCTMFAPPQNGFGSATEAVPVIATNSAGYQSAQEPTGDSFTYQCAPSSCSSTSCGAAPNGCGGTLSCGSCANGEACINSQCCQPKTCGELGKDCGSGYADGCGGTLNCGSCTYPAVCSSGVCGGGNNGNYCAECRATGGICTTSNGKSFCIHE